MIIAQPASLLLDSRPQRYVISMIIADMVPQRYVINVIVIDTVPISMDSRLQRYVISIMIADTYPFLLEARPQRYVRTMIIADTVAISIGFSSPEVCHNYDYSRHGTHFYWILVPKGVSSV